jgi:hypothetical protein
MIIRSTLATVAVSAILSYSAPAFADTPAHPPQIAFSATQLYPETASWSDKEKVFFVSSVRHGTVGGSVANLAGGGIPGIWTPVG